MSQLPDNEATRSALEVSIDRDLRVACYCEENVYRLVYRKLSAKSPAISSGISKTRYYVVFISSETQCVPMFYQKAAQTPTSACLWDYHVVLLQVNDWGDGHGHEAFILDMDSHLPYPCPLNTYVRHAFPAKQTKDIDYDEDDEDDDYAPLFRVVRGDTFLQTFYCDRLHMFQNGQWNAPPPTYACIAQPNRTGSNLDRYRIMTRRRQEESENQAAAPTKEAMGPSFQSDFGIVLNEEQFLIHFGSKSLS